MFLDEDTSLSQEEKYEVKRKLAASIGHTVETAEKSYIYRSYESRARDSIEVTRMANSFLGLPT